MLELGVELATVSWSQVVFFLLLALGISFLCDSEDDDEDDADGSGGDGDEENIHSSAQGGFG